MRCLKCNAENREGASFCRACGAALVRLCASCRAQLPPDSKFCDACGAAVAAPKAGLPVVESMSTAAIALRRLAPAQYAERLLEAGGQMTGERRLVTILFSDVKGSTAMAERLDPEEVMEIMDGALDVLIAPIMRYEGTLARLMGDAILAFFGAPIAHEDDPERACRAALEIVKGTKSYADKLEEQRGIQGFNVRVGINTGLVVVGEVGSDLRVEYTAMGDAVNLAARMEQHAPPGGILITHDTYRHIRGVFDVQPQELLSVKGKAEPVQTYVLLQAKPRAFRLGTRGVEGIETEMVGRAAELKQLQDALHAAMEDRERLVVSIVGEAGVGKSRLLYEFENWVELLPDRVRFFKGRARQETQGLPYGLLRDMFAFRFQIHESDPADRVREKMEQGIAEALGAGSSAQAKAHVLGQLLGYDFSANLALQTLRDDPQALRERAMDYLEEYFIATTELRPTAILLEDLQWADDSSLDGLNRLVTALDGRRLLVACAFRPELLDRRPHWGEGQAFHMRISLEPLLKWDSRKLVTGILRKLGEVPDTLRDLIVSGAEGNPFYIEELIKMLIEDGVIVKADQVWTFEPARLAEVRVPDSLTGVLQSRLDRLPLAERTILQQASVVGRLFWDRAVAHLAGAASEGTEITSVASSLSALREREMVFQRETSAFSEAREYIFKHTLLRETAYASVLKKVRQVYHGLVADWLIQESGERVTELTGMIADHLEAAGRMDQAVDYLLRAGDQARLLYAQQEATAYYQRALTLQRERDERERAARTLMKLGLTYHTAFEFQRSRECYDEAFSLWQQAAAMEPAGSLTDAPHALRLPSSEPVTLDPTLAYDSPSIATIEQLFVGLVEVDAQLDVVPSLAKDWEVTKGGRRYVFHLRDDVRWSDGQPVVAEDVVCMVHRMLHPVHGSYMASILYCIEGAKQYHQGEVPSPESVGLHAADRFTVVMELEEPVAYALHLLTLARPVPQHVIQAHGESWAEPGHIVTNGLFRLQSWDPGVGMTLERNPDYRGRVGGNVQRLELHFLPAEDWTTLLDMYEADELDVLVLREWPSAALEDARRRHAGEYISAPELSTLGIAFNAGRPPFDDLRVRQALTMAIDREMLSGVVLGGTHYPATGGFVPPRMPGHSPGIGLPHDVARAQKLLAEAGYAGGRGMPTLEALVLDTPTSLRSAEFVQAGWEEHLGVQGTWTGLGYEALNARMETHVPHIGPVRWIADYPDPDSFLRVAMTHYRRFMRWRSPEYDRFVDEARRMTRPEDRMRAYQEADRIVTQSAAVVPLVYGRQHLLVKPWCRNVAPSPTGYWFCKDVIIEEH